MAVVDRLGDDALAKASRYNRALQRATLSYWYATIEGREAAMIEATNACVIVNILDESVFEASLGTAYVKHRADDRLGRVVTGLELVRNCEVHSPVSYPELLVETRQIGVPLRAGGQMLRSVWHWAEYGDLPTDYVNLVDDATENQKRARKEAQHGYRRGVASRSVIETLFDAQRFFTDLEPRIANSTTGAVESAFAEVPQDQKWILHRPLEEFIGCVSLPDLATQWDERTMAAAPPADQYVTGLATSKSRDVPAADKRFVTHRIVEDGQCIGYSGVTRTPRASINWVERSAQIGRDIRHGSGYIVEQHANEVRVAANENLKISAEYCGGDLLDALPEADESWGSGRLRLVETYPDLYVSMRKAI